MLRRLLGLAVLAAAGYWLVTEYGPERRRQRYAAEAHQEARAETQRCLAAAEGIVASLGSTLSPYATGRESSGWAALLVDTARGLAAAETACGCTTAGCREAAAVLAAGRRLLEEVDDAARSGRPLDHFERSALRLEARMTRVRDLESRER